MGTPAVVDGAESIALTATNDLSALAWQGLQIVWINILLSGDNAVVIALASRQLEGRRRAWAIGAGSAAAIALRIVLTFFVVAALRVPFVKLVSGALLLWIAFGLLRTQKEGSVEPAASIWAAVRTIVVADAVMSLDNVVAVAAAAQNSVPLVVFGIALSVPLIVFGSTLVLALLRRFPAIVVAGAALLGWVAGEIMATDPFVVERLGPHAERFRLGAQLAGAGLLLIAAAVVRHRRSAGRP